MAQRQFRSDDTSKWLPQYGNGSDGAKTVSGNETYDGANAGGGSTASSGQKNVSIDAASTFANGDLVLIHQSRGTGAGAWELNKIASGGGTTSLVMAYDLCNTYTESGASQFQVVEMKQYSSVTVNSSQTWSSTSWDGNKGGILAFFCNGTTTVTGTISASEKGHQQTPAVPGFEGTTSYAGEGTSGDKVQQTSANGTGGGGTARSAGDFYCGGGGGGHAGSGSAGGEATGGNGSSSGGSGGGSGGTASLVTMIFGGAGGSSAGIAGDGGASGGIIFIVSKNVTVTGAITCAGQAGQNAAGDGDDSGAGGGGSGGSILFKGQTVTLGSSLVSAAFGAGGSDPFHSGNGGAGSNGRIHVDYLSSVSGTTSPTADTRQDKTLVLQGSGAAILLLL